MSSMNKPTRKIMSVANLKVDETLNVRLPENYDVESMMSQILEVGRIVQPIVIRGEDNVVLAGNRRTKAGQRLLEADDTPADVKENLQKVECIVYTGLSPEDTMKIVLDHGTQKGINRTETVLAVWRLDKLMFSEAQIITQMYYVLAKYTGNEAKLADVPRDFKARDAFLKKWLHGTVGNYILAAARMGEYIRQQFILTARAEDKLLKTDEKVEVRCSRQRITDLSAAKNADAREGGWDPDKGGVKFNEMIQKFKDEDAGVIVGDSGPKRPSAKDLKEKSNAFKTSLVRKAFLIGAGESGDQVAGLIDDDDKYHFALKAVELIIKTRPEPLAALADLLANHNAPIADLEKYLQSLKTA
jgi:hypothetical protein